MAERELFNNLFLTSLRAPEIEFPRSHTQDIVSETSLSPIPSLFAARPDWRAAIHRLVAFHKRTLGLATNQIPSQGLFP